MSPDWPQHALADFLATCGQVRALLSQAPADR
jgi:hypothetical protein